jgi:hypothetical protein
MKARIIIVERHAGRGYEEPQGATARRESRKIIVRETMQ